MSISTIRNIAFAALALVTVASAASNANAQIGWVNPVIHDSGRQVTDATYDPFTGQIIVRTDSVKVRESYLDPNRNQVDPGSFRNVNRYETDMNGVRWHVTGTQWTTNGVPHGNLSRRRMGGNTGGPVVEDRNEHVAFGVKTPGTSTTPHKNNQPLPKKNTSRFTPNTPATRMFSPF